MCYMVSDNPLDPNSWEYRGEYVPNEGNFGMGWGNNHTHLHKFQGKYYLFYHSTVLESAMKDGKAMDGGASGYRSIGVNVATVNESKQTINKMTLNKTGVTAIKNLDPYQLQEAETMATCGGFTYEDFSNITKNTGISSLGNDASRALQLKLKAGAWTQLRKVDFGTEGAGSFMLRAKGTGTVEIRLGTKTAKPAASLDFTSTAYQDFNIPVDPAVFKGVKTVFLVCTAATTAYIDAWQFSRETPDAVTAPTAPAVTLPDRSYRLDGSPVNNATQRRGLIIEHRDGQSRKRIVR
jgi:arabinoxylan arabinofuranohydrolase